MMIFYVSLTFIKVKCNTFCYPKYTYLKNLPGTLVPSATMVIAVILSLIRLKHPKWEAKSPITAVSTPI